MMTTGAHGTKGIARIPGHELIDREHAGSGCATGCGKGMGVHGRVRIELHVAFGRGMLENQVYVAGIVHAFKIFRIDQRRIKTANEIAATARR